MRKLLLLFTIVVNVFLNGSVWGQMILRVDDTTYSLGTTGNKLTVSLENYQTISALEFDMMFDPDCFIIDPASLMKTNRSQELQIFLASNPEPGLLMFIGTGIGTFIAAGSGPVMEFSVDVAGSCVESVYEFTLANTILTDPISKYPHEAVNGYISVISGPDCIIDFPATELNIGDVWIGYDGISDLIVSNVSLGAGDITITADGCADADPKFFNLPAGSSERITIICRPEEEGPCEGTLTFSGCGDDVISVTCNGVIPTGTKGDVNDDDSIDVRDVILCLNQPLSLWPFYPSWYWAADCNGPPGNCNGDGIVDVLDALKIVNIILQLDECLPGNVIYFNSFETSEDTIDWIGLSTRMFIDDSVPGCGRKSLHIGGGAASMQPIAILEFQPQSKEGYYTMSCWGKSMNYGSIVLTTTEHGWDEDNIIELRIEGPEWNLYTTEESVFCTGNHRLQIGIIVHGYFSGHSIFVDCLKVECVE